MEPELENYSPVVTYLVERLKEKGFEVKQGTGRQYYEIRATKVQKGTTIVVTLDDENSVDLELVPFHSARFSQVTNAKEADAILGYVDAYID